MRILEITNNTNWVGFLTDPALPPLIDELCGTQCTAHARIIRRIIGPSAHIFQMPTSENEGTIHEDDDSHDFVVINDKIVDTWMVLSEGVGPIMAVFDAPYELYGDPSTWERNTIMESKADKDSIPPKIAELLQQYKK